MLEATVDPGEEQVSRALKNKKDFTILLNKVMRKRYPGMMPDDGSRGDQKVTYGDTKP